MVCWHSRYDLGDKHDFKYSEDFNEWLEENNYIQGENIFMLPLYLYDHSGITMRTSQFSCGWDSGNVGWIYMTAEKLKHEFGLDMNTGKGRERSRSLLNGEVQIYDMYLTGEVYGYTVEPVDSNKIIECNDNCYGFYGDDGIKQAVSDAKASIQYAINEYRAQVVAETLEKIKMNLFMNTSWAF
jgi:hypothetical protein